METPRSQGRPAILLRFGLPSFSFDSTIAASEVVRPKVAACPLKVGHHEHVALIKPESIELVESGTLLLRIGAVTRPELKANPRVAPRAKSGRPKRNGVARWHPTYNWAAI